MLGIPESEWTKIARLVQRPRPGPGRHIQAGPAPIEAALEGLYEYADELIADRAANPGDDFVTPAGAGRRTEDRLSHDELRVSLVLLIFGGMDTTRNQLGLAMQTFIDYPDQWKLLAERPELGKAAVEEVMRVNPTVTWVTREALEDFEYQGLDIKAGTTIHLFSESAGTDPRVFEEPSFDLTAERPPHFGFGGGGTTASATSSPARHERGAAAAGPPAGEPDHRRQRQWLPLSGNTGPIFLPIAFTAAPARMGRTADAPPSARA